jgi:hypothetical protein
VVGATATYRTPLFKGQPTRKDGTIDVELASNATVAVSAVDVAIFLGASLKTVEETRLNSLPTARPRELDDGGVAFRAEASTFISPGGTRHVAIEKAMLPLDRDISTVTVRVIGCRTIRPVGEVTVALPKAKESDEVPIIVWLAAALGALILVPLLLRSLR